MKCQSSDTLADEFNTAETISSRLQTISGQILADVKCPNVDEHHPADIRAVAGISHSDLPIHENSLYNLSEICRLLIKLGDKTSLKLCLEISHKIYTLERALKQSCQFSTLFRGISEIGLNLTDIGVKNVLTGISNSENHILPIDKSIAFRAMTSAAVSYRNILMALKFAQEWQQEARKGGLNNELFCAYLTIQLLYLVCGDTLKCSEGIAQISQHSPNEWNETAAFLKDWTNAMSEGRSLQISHFSEPYPLFIGLPWRTERSESADLPKDFAYLCDMRQKCCCTSFKNRLSSDEIQRYAHIAAQWELPKPLNELEGRLKFSNPEKYHQYFMSRFFGNFMTDEIIGRSPSDPDMIIKNHAVILSTDVRNYSTLSQYAASGEIVDFDVVNPIFKIMNEELEKAGGTILEFVGDRIVMVFNTFRNQQSELSDILTQTIRCFRHIRIFSMMGRLTGLPEIKIGVGINKGIVAVGYIGGLSRCTMTVLGDAINLAARLESKTKELPGDILISKAFFDDQEPEIWKNPEKVNYSLRDLGLHPMKHIRKPVHVYAINPLLRYWIDFVPMGVVAHPEPGVVYLDTGNSGEPGIIDHHYVGHTAKSACELLIRKPELLLGHVQGIPHSEIEFRLHISPDMDCAASFYAACELLGKIPRADILEKLAAYVSLVDQAKIPLPAQMSDSLYGVFKAHEIIARQKHGGAFTDFQLLEAQLKVVDAAVYLMDKNRFGADFSNVFQFEPKCFFEEKRLIEEDRRRYQEDVRRGMVYQAYVNRGNSEPVTGLWLDHPKSIFFRIWAWNDPKAPGAKGYKFLALDMSNSEKNRFVIGVDPQSGTTLEGLGQIMEQHESEKRKQIGKERPIHPIRYPADNSDPWYFGQGHGYAVIDSPGKGTVLTAQEVQDIHKRWKPERK